jgi:hypothetical protein
VRHNAGLWKRFIWHSGLSSLLDTRVIYRGDNLDQLQELPEDCIDLIYIDQRFNSSAANTASLFN